MKILIINGPNLNLLGKREVEIYGCTDFQNYFKELKSSFPDCEISYFQSNHAGQIIDKLQEADKNADGVILNAGAYTHTSLAIGDAVRALQIPMIEVHISNTLSREQIRHKSYIGPAAKGIIMGFGLESYKLAIQGLISTKSSD